MSEHDLIRSFLIEEKMTYPVWQGEHVYAWRA